MLESRNFSPSPSSVHVINNVGSHVHVCSIPLVISFPWPPSCHSIIIFPPFLSPRDLTKITPESDEEEKKDSRVTAVGFIPCLPVIHLFLGSVLVQSWDAPQMHSKSSCQSKRRWKWALIARVSRHEFCFRRTSAMIAFASPFYYRFKPLLVKSPSVSTSHSIHVSLVLLFFMWFMREKAVIPWKLWWRTRGCGRHRNWKSPVVLDRERMKKRTQILFSGLLHCMCDQEGGKKSKKEALFLSFFISILRLLLLFYSFLSLTVWREN